MKEYVDTDDNKILTLELTYPTCKLGINGVETELDVLSVQVLIMRLENIERKLLQEPVVQLNLNV